MHSSHFFTWVFAAVALTAIGPLAGQNSAEKPKTAKLVIKTDEYLVHVIAVATEKGFLATLIEEPTRILLHTSIASGQMRTLYISGKHSRRSPPMGIDRIHHTHKRLSGVVASNDYLLALTWESQATVMLIGAKPAAPRFGNGTYFLTAYDLKSGRQLGQSAIKHGSLPKSPILFGDSSDWLKIEGEKIKVGRKLYRFDGKRFTKEKESRGRRNPVPSDPMSQVGNN